MDERLVEQSHLPVRRTLAELVENLNEPRSNQQNVEQATAILKFVDKAERSRATVNAAESVPEKLKA